MTRLVTVALLGVLCSGCGAAAVEDGPASQQVYDAVAVTLVDVVESAWGTPSAWGNQEPGAVTTLTLDERVASDTFPLTSTGRLPREWTARHARSGTFRATCFRQMPAEFCDREQTTMVVQLSRIQWVGSDSASVEVTMYREDFGSRWRLSLRRKGGEWMVVARTMLMIT